MQAIDLADDLEIVPSAMLRVRCDDPALEGKHNLVWQAATALAASCGRLPLADITVEKRIPVGMGLGGGSSVTRDQCGGPSAAMGTSHAAGSLNQIAAGSVQARPAWDTPSATAGSKRSGDTTSLRSTR